MPPALAAAAAFGIAYRAETDADLPFVAALYASTRAEEVAAAGWPPETQAAFLDQQHRAQHSHFRSAHPDAEWLIVERRGEAVGRLYFAEQAEAVHLIDIALLPAARGGGLGRAILADLLAHAARAGKPVTLRVLEGSPAVRLYERLGFETVDLLASHRRMMARPRG